MPAAKLTPAMEQYMHFKRQHKDAILFFRMGDFYEMFFDDAKEAARLLGLTLTARNHGKSSGSVPLAGVPHHAMEGYVAKLIQLGRKVAVCEQVEDPKKAKGIVKRDVVQVVSPGTALADSMLDQQRNNFLVAVCQVQAAAGLAVVDLSTGDFTLSEIAADQVADELASLAPAELLVGEGVEEPWLEQLRRAFPNLAVSRLEDWHFAYQYAYDTLTEQLKVQSLKGFDCDDLDAGVRAGGGAVSYLRDNQRGTIDHLNRITRRRSDEFVLLDATAQRNLDLLANQQDQSKDNALLGVLDRTLTPMGARLLRQWIVAPLKEPEAIGRRLDAVAALVDGAPSRQQLRDLLRQVGDLERVMARICCQRANARDLVGLSHSLGLVPALRQCIVPLSGQLLEHLAGPQLPAADDLVELLGTALRDDPPATVADGGLIRDGYNAQLDELRGISAGGKNWIAQLQQQERERTGVTSLKVGFNQVFGYYLEISKANQDLVPDNYIRKQTLTNAERYITPELKEYEAKVLGAEDRINELEYELFVALRNQTAAWTAQVQQIARALATLDVLVSLAEVATIEQFTRPLVDDGSIIHIEGGRHPVVEKQLQQGNFVPNDVHIDSQSAQILLITGPNMAGKSTVIRQVGLIVLMAQMGGFVPARQARIGAVDRIFTRVGASDNLARGESTFMVEMHEAASILNNATSRSLILMDELGRGTSTFDGLSIAWAIVEFLHHEDGSRPLTLFATHYHELTELAEELAGLVNYNVQVREEEDRVVFLHRIAPGPCNHSYGIHVAQMAGMPASVVERAHQILRHLEAEQIDTDQLHPTTLPAAQSDTATPEEPPTQPAHVAENPPQLNLFAAVQTDPIAAELQRLDLSQITPLQALLKLNEWKENLRRQDDPSA
ncbi:MAG: DNA mismatch repair protein MutS [Candidatus Latescibacteria bacterium]|nr:DNA mismatch repair protein MutS [Candidatus Latescibacterota bacterium]